MQRSRDCFLFCFTQKIVVSIYMYFKTFSLVVFNEENTPYKIMHILLDGGQLETPNP